MTRNERKALTAQLARRLDDRPDVPIAQRLFSIFRARPVQNIHPCFLTDEDMYLLLNPPTPVEEK